nr:hypothetical protein [Comamonas sp. SCN 65-56]
MGAAAFSPSGGESDGTRFCSCARAKEERRRACQGPCARSAQGGRTASGRALGAPARPRHGHRAALRCGQRPGRAHPARRPRRLRHAWRRARRGWLDLCRAPR